MGQTLLNEKTADLLLLRAKALSSASTGAWGNMNVTDMLYHCNTINNAILQSKKNGAKANLETATAENICPTVTSSIPQRRKDKP